MKNNRDFSRVFDKGNKLIGCLNFNNMLPVDDSVLLPIDMRVQKGDSAKDKMKNLTRRCCDFKKLEHVLEKREKLGQ